MGKVTWQTNRLEKAQRLLDAKHTRAQTAELMNTSPGAITRLIQAGHLQRPAHWQDPTRIAEDGGRRRTRKRLDRYEFLDRFAAPHDPDARIKARTAAILSKCPAPHEIVRAAG